MLQKCDKTSVPLSQNYAESSPKCDKTSVPLSQNDEALEAFFARTPRLAVALSGGVDSCYVLAAAAAAGCAVHAYVVSTAFQAPRDVRDALAYAQVLGVPVTLIEEDVLAHESIAANPPDRCYFCKTLMFRKIREHMARDGYEVLADGTNASDCPDRRPGFRALAEQQVESPLRRAGMTKDDVRAAARALEVPTADKQSFSCYAVHVAASERITAQALRQAAERLGHA